MSDTLTIVVPCYNEQEVLPETVKELGNILQYLIDNSMVSDQSKILFVDRKSTRLNSSHP